MTPYKLFPDFVTFTLSPFCFSFSFFSQGTEAVLAVLAVWAAPAVLGAAKARRAATSRVQLWIDTMVTLARWLFMYNRTRDVPLLIHCTNLQMLSEQVITPPAPLFTWCVWLMRTSRWTKLLCGILSALYCINPRDWFFLFYADGSPCWWIRRPFPYGNSRPQ